MAPDSVTAYVGWDAAAKKRRYVTKTVHGGKRQAEKALADFVSEVNKQQHAAAAAVVESATIGKLPVAKLRPHHIEDLYTDLLAKGQSGSSIRKVSPPASSDVRMLVEHALASDPDWGTAIAFVAWTGCRRGEVCGLRWKDVDLDAKSALIAQSVVSVPGGVQIKGTKTGEVRRIALGTKAVAVLRAHRERCDTRAAPVRRRSTPTLTSCPPAPTVAAPTTRTP